MGNVLTDVHIGQFIKSLNVRTYEKGQTIVYPEDRNERMYVIKQGAVTMERINDAGERKVLYIFGTSSLFPMVSFLEKDVVSSWFYTAIVDTEVYVIPYDELTARLKEVDGFRAYNTLLKQLLMEVHELLFHISDHAKTDSTEKVTSILLFLMEHHTKRTSNAWRAVSFPVTHQLLADMTGLARETVSLTMKELAKKRIIRYQEKGRLELNIQRLSKQHHA